VIDARAKAQVGLPRDSNPLTSSRTTDAAFIPAFPASVTFLLRAGVGSPTIHVEGCRATGRTGRKGDVWIERHS
jgi:hypothetical protein